MPLPSPLPEYSRVKTLRQLINDLQELVSEHPDAGDLMVCTQQSASGALDHLNSFHLHTLTDYDMNNEFGFFYEDENLVEGDKVIILSVGGN